MRRPWTIALVGVALVAAAVLWLIRDGKRRTPPEPVPASPVTARRPAEPVAPAVAGLKPPDCTPLPGGGLSCGACRNNADCPDGSTCVVNPLNGRTECKRPSCTKNEDCPEGTLCRVVGRTSSDEPLRACVPSGARPAGAVCDPNQGGDPTVSCGPKLVCVNGGCAPPCERREVDDDPVCPAGHECIETEAGWGCIPTCKIEPCPAGKTCSFLSDENPISLCTYPDGPNCLGSKGGCPANTDCIVETNARSERTTFRCHPRCGADQSCPDGSVCVPGRVAGKKMDHCRRGCSPDTPTQCGPGERCVRAGGASGSWFCSAT
jgi:hypothetical protein